MDAIDRALLECLRSGAGDSSRIDDLDLSPTDWDQLVRRARAHCVVPLVYRRLRSAPDGTAPPDVLRSLHGRARRIALRNVRLFAELRAVVTSFRQANIPLMVLKGAVLAPEVYGDVSLREMSDLDLLVRRSDLASGLRHLLATGFRPLEALPRNALADTVSDRLTRRHHVPRLVKQGVVVELHWTLLTPARVPPAPLDALWDRANPVAIAGAEALAPSLEDLLLHTCAHAAYNHRFEHGLRPYCDVRQILETRRREVRWALLMDRARAWGWGPGVLLALLLSHRLMASAVPREVLDEAAVVVPPELVRDAEEMALSDPRETNRLPPSLAEWHHRPTLRKGLVVLGRVWTWLRRRPETVDPSLGYYTRRVLVLLRHRLPIAYRLLRGDPATNRLATRKSRLSQWLTTPGSP